MNSATLGLPRRKDALSSSSRSVDLEDDIESISNLDLLRRKAARLRKDGLKSLAESSVPERWTSGPVSRTDAEETTRRKELRKTHPEWAYDADEPSDFIGPALAVLVATRHFSLETCRKASGSLKPYWAEAAGRLKQYSLDSFKRSEVPVLEAARVLHSLMSCPDLALTPATVYAYYRVIEELQGVDTTENNFIVGAARANKDSHPSAFVTAECLRAVQTFARSLRRTGELLITIEKFFADCQDLLKKCSSSTGPDALPISYPNEWANAEFRRISLHYATSLSRLARHALIQISPETLGELLVESRVDPSSPAMPPSVGKFLKRLIGDLIRCRKSLPSLQRAIDDVNDLMQRERKLWLKEIVSPTGNGAKLIKKAQKLMKQLEPLKADADVARSAEWSSVMKFFKLLAEALSEAARGVERHFEPARRYLETVLDHEIVKRPGQILRSGELACAAGAFAVMERHREIHDRRLRRAAELLQKNIGPDGAFETATHLRTGSDGAHTVMLLGSEVIRAFAQLLEVLPLDVRPEIIERMLRYFETHIVRSPRDAAFIAWTTDRPGTPKLAHRWITSLALLALERIIRMLDEQINNRIFRHFSVRGPQQLDDGIHLGSLIYPDYGLATLARNDKIHGICPREADGQSIAFFLERARAHIEGIPRRRNDNRCYSMLLYGPPGTGKTTFIEALAKTTNRYLLEVTPSDIIVQGESQVERRARVVFRALSMVSRTVILFDEFDPVLKDRTGDEKRETSVFSFVTPGMLPKLKELNRAAKERQVVFALATNRIGTLDEAAIRSGRFDYKIGVFPPDAISLAGSIARALLDASPKFDKKSGIDVSEIGLRAARLVVNTARAGMTTLGAEGNLRPLKVDRWSLSDFDENTILQVAFGKSEKAFEAGLPDANPDRLRTGQGDYLVFEDRQWAWILQLDDHVASFVESHPSAAKHNIWVELCQQMRLHANGLDQPALDASKYMQLWRDARNSAAAGGGAAPPT